MAQHNNINTDLNIADLAWLLIAIRAAAADTDDIDEPLIQARLATVLPNQPQANIAEQLSQLQQLNILHQHNQYWQLSPDFSVQLIASTNCGCGYQAQWGLTKAVLTQWIMR